MARVFSSASSQSVNCGDINALDGIAQMTLSFWAKKSVGNQWLLSKSSSSTSALFLQSFTDGKVYATVRTSGSRNLNVSQEDNNWHHYAMVYDGSQSTDATKLLLYIDGVLQSLTPGGAGSISTTTPSTSAPLLIADYISTSHYYSDAAFAEVRTWDTNLNANEILMDMTGIICRGANLQGYWRLGVGSPEPDWSGNGYNGTLGNAPTIADHPPVGPAWQWSSRSRSIVVPAAGSGLLMHPGMDGLSGRYFNSKMNGGLNG